MLLQLSIKNLAIVEQIDLEFAHGMTVLTGETGAGKSILLDGLGLLLGDRGSASLVRAPHKQAEVAANFAVDKLTEVKFWLKNNDFDPSECVIRRIITIDGKSKAYINGSIVTLTQLKQLGELLVNIHSQHQHHALLNIAYQREILDQYANHDSLLQKVEQYFNQWKTVEEEYQKLLVEQDQKDKLNLLNYQIQEITELELKEGELADLEQEHKKLTKADDLLTEIQQIFSQMDIDTDQNMITTLHGSASKLKKLQQFAPELQSSTLVLDQVTMLLTEVSEDLRSFLSNLNIDPARLIEIDTRLSAIYTLVRKHNIGPEFIAEYYNNLIKQRDLLLNKQQKLKELDQQIDLLKQQYMEVANKLTQSRQKAAKTLANKISEKMKILAMPHADVKIEVKKSNKPHSYGLDEILFLVSTNPGQELHSLNKIASGGELSRTSLAVQMILTSKLRLPVLIFDEVDAGISGGIAETVGQMLRTLGEQVQVLCVTHLPQVAAQGHHHLKVTKRQTKTTTSTDLIVLKGKTRVEELARLLGGNTITKQALANADVLLTAVE